MVGVFRFDPCDNCCSTTCKINNDPPTNMAVIEIEGITGNAPDTCAAPADCINGTWHLYGSGCGFIHYSTGSIGPGYPDDEENPPLLYSPDSLAFLTETCGNYGNNVLSLGYVHRDGIWYYQCKDYYNRHIWECDCGEETPTSVTTPMVLTPAITGNEWFDTSASTVTVKQFYHTDNNTIEYPEWQVNSNKMVNCGSPGVEMDCTVRVWATEITSDPSLLWLLDYNFPAWCRDTFICRPYSFNHSYDAGTSIWWHRIDENNMVRVYCGPDLYVNVGWGIYSNPHTPSRQFWKTFDSLSALQAGGEIGSVMCYPPEGVGYETPLELRWGCSGVHIANIHCSVSWG
jgi:hypothetical protein